MSLQSLLRVPKAARLIRAKPTFTGLVCFKERGKALFKRVFRTLEESKQREGTRLIRRYRHLIDG